MSYPKVLAMLMAGSEGARLHPLTAERSKPAVPFAGRYRIVDIKDCIIMDYVTLRRGVRLRRVIVDRYNEIAAGVRKGGHFPGPFHYL